MKDNVDPNTITRIVAIDGPAGAGKSTVARRVAARLGFAFLDTGAMYRAATWRALDAGADMDDEAAMAASTRAMELDITEQNGVQRVLVDGRDVTQAIRSPEVTRLIYKLDRKRDVRAHLVELQRAFGARGPCVAEGRDIGTVVFPRAKCKIFLVASLDERTRRRAAEMAQRGLPVDFDTLREEIRVRDEMSASREESPLRQAEDALLVDTSNMTIDEVVEHLSALAEERL